MMLFGYKTIAWFDIWSLEHLIAGMSALTIATYVVHKMISGTALPPVVLQRFTFCMLVLMAYMWETLEHYLESGVTGNDAVTYWFQGVEFWGNRLITDPLMIAIGGYIAMKHTYVIIPARIFSCVWLIIHIGLFPHSMYIHTLLSF